MGNDLIVQRFRTGECVEGDPPLEEIFAPFATVARDGFRRLDFGDGIRALRHDVRAFPRRNADVRVADGFLKRSRLGGVLLIFVIGPRIALGAIHVLNHRTARKNARKPSPKTWSSAARGRPSGLESRNGMIWIRDLLFRKPESFVALVRHTSRGSGTVYAASRISRSKLSAGNRKKRPARAEARSFRAESGHRRLLYRSASTRSENAGDDCRRLG